VRVAQQRMRLERAHLRERLSYSTSPGRGARLARARSRDQASVHLTSRAAPPKMLPLNMKFCDFDGKPSAAQRCAAGLKVF
jgi:hypothetical protein